MLSSSNSPPQVINKAKRGGGTQLVKKEIGKGAKDLESASGIGANQVIEGEIVRESDGGKHLLGLAEELHNPNGVEVEIRVVEVVQSSEIKLPVRR